MLPIRASLFGFALALIACGGHILSPITSERRSVRSDTDASKTITVLHEIVWDDGSPPRNALHLPAGIYTLEASDEEYWYLRARGPLELQETHKGGRTDTRHLAGGIMLGKYSFRAIPAAAYIDGDSAVTRILVWKAPGTFLAGEGRDWRRSF
jgi:hypothetical protein